MMSEPTAQDFDQARELLNQLLTEVSEQESTLAGGTKPGAGGKAVQTTNSHGLMARCSRS